MNTKPTPSPELPDLDRDHLDYLERVARAATKGPWDTHPITDDELYPRGLAITAAGGETISDEDTGPGDDDAAFIAAANPAAVLALIALARRAQPEGKVVVSNRDAARYRYIATLQDWSEIERLCRNSTASSAAQFKRDLDKLIDARRPTFQPEGEASQAELVALHDELNRITWEGEDEGWNLAIAAVQKRIRELLGTPSTSAEEPYSAKLAKRGAPVAEVRAAERVEAMHAGVVGVFAAIKDQHAAAQHAESGAQAMRECPECDGTGRISPVALCARCDHSGVLPALAAQSQGAQALPYAYHYEWADCVTTDGPQGFKWKFDKEAPPEWAVQDGQCRNVIPLAIAAQQAAAPGSLDLMNADEMAALRRFDETCQDGEGYDVPKTMMQRLAAIGVVRRTSGSYYETTEFGLRVLHQSAPIAPGTPEAPALWQTCLDLAHSMTDEHGDWIMVQLPKPAEGRSSAEQFAIAVQRAAQLDGGQEEGEKA